MQVCLFVYFSLIERKKKGSVHFKDNARRSGVKLKVGWG